MTNLKRQIVQMIMIFHSATANENSNELFNDKGCEYTSHGRGTTKCFE